MGVPYIDVPCKVMVKAGKAFSIATEDVDALTFGTNILLCHLISSDARKMPVQDFFYNKNLQGWDVIKEQMRK